jgi:hypothetical protein
MLGRVAGCLQRLRISAGTGSPVTVARSMDPELPLPALRTEHVKLAHARAEREERPPESHDLVLGTIRNAALMRCSF